jgi:RNA polymerase sigma factor (sigma-70 family)
MSNGAAWVALKDRFLCHVRSTASALPAHWNTVWRLLVCDPWYQRQLYFCARKLLRRNNGPPDWLEDVQQEAITILGRQLQCSPDLHVDAARVEEHFAPWMRWIIYRTCQEAVRRQRRACGRTMYLTEVELDELATEHDAQTRVELDLAIEALEEPRRTVLALYTGGSNVKEIAGKVGLNYWRTYRVWQEGLNALRARLSEDPVCDRPFSAAASGCSDETTSQHQVA